MSHEIVAENSKNLAEKYSQEKNFGRAFSHYLIALNLKPEWKCQFRDDFLSVLCKWGTTLEEKKRFEDLFFCYEQALEIFPEDIILLNNIGSHLLRCGSLNEAAHYFRKCLKINPHFLRASLNLENVSNLAVERWHFRMLNDRHRNEAFREAILKKVKMGFDRVLDVGTGTGLLSLFCLEGGAKEVYACDLSPTMIKIAEGVLGANDATDVRLMCKHSRDIHVGEDIPRKVSLLVTETFDAGLLGEGIIQTLDHAWENLLVPSGLVIPFSATLYITGIECDSISDTYFLKPNDYLNDFRAKCDSYDTHDLKRSGFRCLTDTVKICDVDFNDLGCIKTFLHGCEWKVTLTCNVPGRLDCFAVWFDLHLDEDIVLRTNPGSEDNIAWDQAIFPLHRQQYVKPDQQLHVIANFKDKLNIVLEGGIKPEISEEVIRTLNDGTLRNVSRQVSNLLAEPGPVNILDLFPFPVFGLDLIFQRKGFKNRLSCDIPDWDLISPFLNHLSADFEWIESRDDVKFDIIFVNFVEMRGELKDGILPELNYWKSLNPNCTIIPEKVTVMGQFIYSDFLTKASKVTDDATCGYKIAEFINAYQVQHYMDIDFASLEKEIYSEPFELFDVFDSVDAPTVRERIVQSVPDCQRTNALIYWFHMRLMQNCELSTKEGLYRQAALLFFEVNGPEVRFEIVHCNGLFNINLL